MTSRLEAFARICVTGFLFDPEVSMFSLFSSPSAVPSDPYTPTPAPTPGMARQTSLNRGPTVTQRLQRLQKRLLRPFALPSRPPVSAYPMTATNVNGTTYRDNGLPNSGQRPNTSFREAHDGTMLSMVMRSDTHPQDSVALPFRLSIGHLHDKTQRNVPYLRQSWSRIDFIAIVSFWITFALAVTGTEKGKYHIGIFRAMSVIRTARLLTITSGTTVSRFCFPLFVS